MRQGKNALKLIKGSLESNEKLKQLIAGGDKDISAAVTTKPTLNMTKLNQDYNFLSYVSVSINKVEAYINQDTYYLKANVVVDQINHDDPASLALDMAGTVIREITRTELNLGFDEQIVFGEMEETYFDLDEKTWGYVIIFAVSGESI